jgi:hypothetical protein
MTNPNPRFRRGLGQVCRSDRIVGTPDKYLDRPAAAIPSRTSVSP